MNTVAIIQARMGSTRLPGKVLKDLFGKTVLAHVIERARAAGVDVLIATTDKIEDNAIELEAQKNGAKVFRGSEDDVLSRYYLAAVEAKADLIVRITSDCPLYDGALLKSMLAVWEGHDYLTNTIKRTYPRGLDTEIITFKTLEVAHNNAKEMPQREHVTPYVYQNPGLFNIAHYTGKYDLSGNRWTLDTEEDWQMISAVYKALYKGKTFSTGEVLKFLEEHPEVRELNAHIEQKKL